MTGVQTCALPISANPELSYRQVIEILKETATDLNTPGWDPETGAGLLNMAAAVGLARTITPVNYEISPIILPETWNDFVARERAARVPYTFRSGDTLWGIAQARLGNGARWVEIQKANGSTYTSQEARSISIGTVIYLPGSSQTDRKSTRLNSSHLDLSRMPSSA